MYTAYCQIPGHEAAGMTAMLHVGMGGARRRRRRGTQTAAENDQHDAVMKAPVDAYVKQLDDGANTKGVGAQVMEPTVLPDGTKQFDLTAAITDWEVSPGNDGEGVDLQRHRARPDDQGEPGRPRAGRARQPAAAVDRHPLPRHHGAERDGRRARRHPATGEAGRRRSPTTSSLDGSRGRACTTRTTTPSTRCPTA